MTGTRLRIPSLNYVKFTKESDAQVLKITNISSIFHLPIWK